MSKSQFGEFFLVLSETEQPEYRFGNDDVSDDISRVFFGKGIQSGTPGNSGYQPPSIGYGFPKGTDLDEIGFGRSVYRG